MAPTMSITGVRGKPWAALSLPLFRRRGIASGEETHYLRLAYKKRFDSYSYATTSHVYDPQSPASR